MQEAGELLTATGKFSIPKVKCLWCKRTVTDIRAQVHSRGPRQVQEQDPRGEGLWGGGRGARVRSNPGLCSWPLLVAPPGSTRFHCSLQALNREAMCADVLQIDKIPQVKPRKF
jgi:hypothetical protein